MKVVHNILNGSIETEQGSDIVEFKLAIAA